jgi:hypothetical protein
MLERRNRPAGKILAEEPEAAGVATLAVARIFWDLKEAARTWMNDALDQTRRD